MVAFMSAQTKTHSLGFRQWQTWLRAVERERVPVANTERMVVLPAAYFWVDGSNPDRAHMPAPPPMARDCQGLAPPAAKIAAECGTIRP